MTDCYCGTCCQLCAPISHHSRYLDEGYGATKTFEEVEITSDCCDSDDLYSDPELTKEYEPEFDILE